MMNKKHRADLREMLATSEKKHQQALEELGLMQAGPIITKFESSVLYEFVPGLLDQIDKLEEALHDAIRRPMGVVPDSATPFITEEGLEEAEARRPRIYDSEPE